MLLYNLVDLLDGTRVWWSPSWEVAKEQAYGSAQWFVALFGAAYAGLYTRFASQWSYLAGVYNAIKAAETRAGATDGRALIALAEWKAGFIEDADSLHLATKPTIAPIILAWGRDELVSGAFHRHVPGGARRLSSLIDRVERSLARWEERHKREWQKDDGVSKEPSLPVPRVVPTDTDDSDYPGNSKN